MYLETYRHRCNGIKDSDQEINLCHCILQKLLDIEQGVYRTLMWSLKHIHECHLFATCNKCRLTAPNYLNG